MMSEHTPSTEHLGQQVERLEQKLGAHDGDRADALMGHYWGMVAQIKVDLGDERDQWLARLGALMLAQAACSDPPAED